MSFPSKHAECNLNSCYDIINFWSSYKWVVWASQNFLLYSLPVWCDVRAAEDADGLIAKTPSKNKDHLQVNKHLNVLSPLHLPPTVIPPPSYPCHSSTILPITPYTLSHHHVWSRSNKEMFVVPVYKSSKCRWFPMAAKIMQVWTKHHPKVEEFCLPILEADMKLLEAFLIHFGKWKS